MSLFKQAQKLREERCAAVDAAGKLLVTLEKEEREWTPAENEEFDKRHATADELKKKIDVLERQIEAEKELGTEDPTDPVDPRESRGSDALAAKDKRNRILRSFMLGEERHLEEGDSESLEEYGLSPALLTGPKATARFELLNTGGVRLLRRQELGIGRGREYRMTTSAGAGGETIAQDESLRSMIETSLLAFGGMREVATIIRSATGADLPIPTSDDTGNVGEILTEGAAVNTQDIATGSLILQAYKYSSKMVKASIELLQDAAFDIESWIGERIGERIGRITNTHYTTGTGTGQPKGAVTAANTGKTTATATVILFTEVIDLVHSVNRAYRRGARFMLEDLTLSHLKKKAIGSSDARPLWQSGVAVGAPDTIDGFPYTINDDMDAIAATNDTMLFGQLTKYLIRDVREVEILVLRERFADNHQVAFLAFMRSDGDLLDAGTDPIKKMTQAA